jgi:hypothetical protein
MPEKKKWSKRRPGRPVATGGQGLGCAAAVAITAPVFRFEGNSCNVGRRKDSTTPGRIGRRKQGGYHAPFTALGLQPNVAESSWLRQGVQLLGLLLNSPGQLLFVC